MSAELFAEFGTPSNETSQPKPQPAPANDPFSFFTSSLSSALPPAQPSQPASQWSSSQIPAALGPSPGIGSGIGGGLSLGSAAPQPPPPTSDEDDGWGDFEVASPSFVDKPSNSITSGVASKDLSKPLSFSAPPPTKTRIVRASTIDMMTNNLVDVSTGSNRSLAQQSTLEPRPKNRNPNVLFDADDYEGEAPIQEEDDDNDDEFGDFETVAVAPPPPKAPAASSAMMDLLSSGFAEPAQTAGFSKTSSSVRSAPPSQLLASPALTDGGAYPQAPKSPSFQERNPFKGLAVTTPLQDEFSFADGSTKQPVKKPDDTTSPVTAWPGVAPEADKKQAPSKDTQEDWGAFDDFTPDKPPADTSNPGWDWDVADGVVHQPSAGSAVTPFPGGVSKKPTPDPKSAAKKKETEAPKPKETADASNSGWDWESVTPDKTQPQPAAALDDKAPPPTNVPPPSILLSLFPALLELPNEALFKPTATQSAGVKARVLADPATASFLSGYLALATVAARILAGRKQRWHRDRFLAQSMAISAAGGKGGMKLAGVDKAQAAREDREAADVAAVWRANVGRLRAAVASAAAANPNDKLRVPDLSERPAVSTAKNVPTSPKACVICGLKRDERVKAVDFEVEDSFGEWWVEHWGHRACRNFWLEHEAKLRQR